MPSPRAIDAQRRLRCALDAHWRLIARALRHLGVEERDVQDRCQEVFLVLSAKLGDVEEGGERAFLLRTAANVAAHARRQYARRREDLRDGTDMGLELEAAGNAEAAVDQRRARAWLQQLLEELPEDQRAIFVLFEIERLSLPDIAGSLGIPLGTATSRLLRARERFQRGVERLRNAGVTGTKKGGQS